MPAVAFRMFFKSSLSWLLIFRAKRLSDNRLCKWMDELLNLLASKSKTKLNLHCHLDVWESITCLLSSLASQFFSMRLLVCLRIECDFVLIF
jgi:hypothetical protein